jgi:hypothetical protein
VAAAATAAAAVVVATAADMLPVTVVAGIMQEVTMEEVIEVAAASEASMVAP